VRWISNCWRHERRMSILFWWTVFFAARHEHARVVARGLCCSEPAGGQLARRTRLAASDKGGREAASWRSPLAAHE
jgi:hypothetical protein